MKPNLSSPAGITGSFKEFLVFANGQKDLLEKSSKEIFDLTAEIDDLKCLSISRMSDLLVILYEVDFDVQVTNYAEELCFSPQPVNRIELSRIVVLDNCYSVLINKAMYVLKTSKEKMSKEKMSKKKCRRKKYRRKKMSTEKMSKELWEKQMYW
ncbi:unnamed protein product [Didymodactylos carnosus]|uniref:Uncharacterized protein n=1 Tax=Didymodactylos carnosus TaxID=1234261 RepID=A0A8S2R6N6_9BILA|nr:unnamed protein product [Didymodactylos carnosus]CAF4145204.1 unnamed protein product [Didymodactylos carnosus]